MSGAVHPLQKAVTAIVDAVQAVGEVEIALAADAETLRGLQQETAVFLGEDECRTALLQAEVLAAAIENLAVALAGDGGGPRVAREDVPGARMRLDSGLYVDDVEHLMPVPVPVPIPGSSRVSFRERERERDRVRNPCMIVRSYRKMAKLEFRTDRRANFPVGHREPSRNPGRWGSSQGTSPGRNSGRRPLRDSGGGDARSVGAAIWCGLALWDPELAGRQALLPASFMFLMALLRPPATREPSHDGRGPLRTRAGIR